MIGGMERSGCWVADEVAGRASREVVSEFMADIAMRSGIRYRTST